MNYSAVKYILSYVLMIEGALLLFPFIVGVLYMEQKSVWYLLVAVICIVLGVLGTRHKPKNAMFYFKEGCLATAASWITLSIFGSLPLILTGEYPSYVDALFEIVSGFTTTGATVLSDVECLCHATLFWRCIYTLDRWYGCTRLFADDHSYEWRLQYESDACGEPGAFRWQAGAAS